MQLTVIDSSDSSESEGEFQIPVNKRSERRDTPQEEGENTESVRERMSEDEVQSGSKD